MSINFSHPKLYQPKDKSSLCEFHVAVENQFNTHEIDIKNSDAILHQPWMNF